MSVKSGDPVRVRLSTGEVVNAVYYSPAVYDKCHHVYIGRIPYLALGGKYVRKGVRLEHGCRFVGPTPMVKKKENNSE